jgi:hypothetical protein
MARSTPVASDRPRPPRRPWPFRMGMPMAAITLGAAILLVVYLMSPPSLEDPGAVAACLPPGITLATVAEYRPTTARVTVKNTTMPAYEEITVRRKLAELGAYHSGGKLYDANGREIRFFKGYGGGAKPPPQMVGAEQRERQRLRDLYTVIELAPFDPRDPPQ